jgi:hypothetical protein
MLAAARLVKAGFDPSQIVTVEVAGEVGGTWYWNRYPRLHCDIKPYVYMPLLVETGIRPYTKSRFEYQNPLLSYSSPRKIWAFRKNALSSQDQWSELGREHTYMVSTHYYESRSKRKREGNVLGER